MLTERFGVSIHETWLEPLSNSKNKQHDPQIVTKPSKICTAPVRCFTAMHICASRSPECSYIYVLVKMSFH